VISSPSSSRPPAAIITPIEYGGIRYVQDQHDDRDDDQPGGYLAAIDIATGARLWRLQVYAIADTRGAGIAPVPIYFRSLRLEDGGDFLEIEDETGRVFRVSLASRSVTQVAGPPATASPQQSPKAKPMPD